MWVRILNCPQKSPRESAAYVEWTKRNRIWKEETLEEPWKIDKRSPKKGGLSLLTAVELAEHSLNFSGAAERANKSL